MSRVSEFDGFASGLVRSMLIVTVRRGEERSGCLVGFSTQTSIHPSRFLVCLSVENHTYAVAREAAHLGVHAVPEDRDDLAELFGGETGDELDKFGRCDWRDGPAGVPVLDGCPSWFAGEVVERLPFGDHVGFVLAPLAAHSDPDRHLLSPDAETIDPGHAP